MPTTRRRLLCLAGGTALAALAAPARIFGGVSPVRAQLIPGSPTFTGTAGDNQVVGPVTLSTGVTVVRAQFNGTTNFAANLILPSPGTRPTDAYPATGGFFGLLNQIGAFTGGAVALVSVPGDYYLVVSSAGAYKISVEQPLPETVSPVQQTSFSGSGTAVSPYFTLPDGITTITMQTADPAAVAALYHLDDLGGEAIVAGVQGSNGTLFDFRDPTNQPTVALTLPDAGPYVLAVGHAAPGRLPWTVAFA